MERIPKINQLIKKEVSQALLREMDFPENILVTITRVETYDDLLQAKVSVSVFPEEKTKETLKALDKAVYLLQQRINKRLRMRPIPKIFFREEKQTKAAGRIEEILAKIQKND
jgi:ribosome-binding factor A